MRILIPAYGSRRWDIFPDPDSGRELQIWGLGKALARLGHEVIIAKDGAIGTEIASGVQVIGIDVSGFEGPNEDLKSALEFGQKLRQLMKQMQPEMISIHYRLSGWPMTNLGIPTTYTIHVPDIIPTFRRSVIRHEMVSYPRTVFESLIERRILRSTDQIIVLNHFMQKYLMANIGLSAKCIPCAVDPERYENRGDDNYILYAGRIDWVKSPRLLVEAYANLDEKLKDKYRLRIVGSGIGEEDLMKYIARTGLEERIDVEPWTKNKNLAQIMGKCTTLVLPSLYETFGIVLLEAMASGKTVIASDIPGPQDFIRERSNGLLFTPGNSQDLTAVLTEVLQNGTMRERLGYSARQDVRDKFSFTNIARMYEDIFLELIRKPSSLNNPCTEALSVLNH